MTNFLEESLSYSLVYNDQSNFRKLFLAISRIDIVLVSQDLLELFQFVLDNLLSHRITNTISVNEDMIWELSSIIVSVSLKSTAIIVLQNVRGDDLLTLLVLRACLSIILAEERIVGSNETNGTVLTLVAHINTD